MTKVLEGRAALITGSGNGIGRATALRMASMGAIDRRQRSEAGVRREGRRRDQAAGGKAVAVTQNVSTRDGMRNAVLGFAKQQGRLDILVNNAAWVRYQSVPDIAPETMDRMLDIGFKGVIWGIQAAAEAMDPERGGAIVNIASVAGLVSAKNSIVYSGIKAGVMGITRAAAAELGARKIRVNAIAPQRHPDRRHDAKPQRRARRAPHRAHAAGAPRHRRRHRQGDLLPRQRRERFRDRRRS